MSQCDSLTRKALPPDDDAFLHASYVPAPAGPAYVDDAGKLRAGVNIWAWREFFRRSATMQHTLESRAGEPTVLYAHMTNVNMVPWLSWASINLVSAAWGNRCPSHLSTRSLRQSLLPTGLGVA